MNGLIGNSKPDVVAYPPTDRFVDALSEGEIEERSKKRELRVLFSGDVMGRKG